MVNLCAAGVAEYRDCFIGDSHCSSSALAELQCRHVVEQKPGHRNQTLTGEYVFFNILNEMYFIYHKIIHLKSEVLWYIFRTLQPSPQSNFRSFSTSQTETSYTLIVISIPLAIHSTTPAPETINLLSVSKDFPVLDISHDQNYLICCLLHLAKDTNSCLTFSL